VTVDRENKKIGLSLKQVEENPWTRIEAKYHVGDTVPAKITKLAQFGAFAELEPGVEGLVHISELSDERITHPKQVVREGEDVQLRIIKIDPPRHRLGLSLRQAEDTADVGNGGYEAWGGSSYGGTTATSTDLDDGATGIDDGQATDAAAVHEATVEELAIEELAAEEAGVAEVDVAEVAEEPALPPRPVEAALPEPQPEVAVEAAPPEPPAGTVETPPAERPATLRTSPDLPSPATHPRPNEPADTVRAVPADKAEPAATEPAANGTARVPER
jgi:predicted RNA-binding protein with RPS1 domain